MPYLGSAVIWLRNLKLDTLEAYYEHVGQIWSALEVPKSISGLKIATLRKENHENRENY